jgi:hypothetical protein
MTSLNRVRATWSGFAGAPGVSTFYGLGVGTLPGFVRTFFNALTAYYPAGTTIQVENFGDVIDDVTGHLVGSWTGSAQTLVTSVGSGSYAAPSGASVKWVTDSVLDGHRVRGRTFLVPLISSAFQSDGSLAAAFKTTLETAATTLAATGVGEFVVWHRPVEAKAADGSRPAVVARDGGHALVTASSVRDVAAVLRSRRD